MPDPDPDLNSLPGAVAALAAVVKELHERIDVLEAALDAAWAWRRRAQGMADVPTGGPRHVEFGTGNPPPWYFDHGNGNGGRP